MAVAERASAGVPLSGINDPGTPLYQALVGLADGLAIGGQQGPGLAGLPGVNLESAQRLSAVYRSVSILSTVARLPLQVFEKVDGARRQVEDPREAYVWRRPNPEMTRSVFWETVISHLALAGNAFVYAAKTQLGEVGEIWPINPQRVRVGRDPQTRAKVFTVDGDYAAPYLDFAAGGELVHIPNLSVNGLVGVNPIRAARMALQLGMATETYGAQLFAQGSTPGGIITTDQELKDEDAEKLGRRWEKFHRGLGNAHRVAVLDSGGKFQQVSISPEDSQFLDTRRFQVQEIARLFGVPPHLLADSSGSTSWGSGLEEQNRMLVAFTFNSYSSRIEEAITDQLLAPANRYARFNYDGLLRGNTLQRYQAYEVAHRSGWLSADEIRAYEDLEPIPGGLGAVYMEPVALAPLSMVVGQQDKASSAPAPAA